MLVPHCILFLSSVQLLNTERLSIFAADLQVSFLLFEALRTHLKFQLEFYLTRVIDIIISDSPKITYEQKEIALGNISVQCIWISCMCDISFQRDCFI